MTCCTVSRNASLESLSASVCMECMVAAIASSAFLLVLHSSWLERHCLQLSIMGTECHGRTFLPPKGAMFFCIIQALFSKLRTLQVASAWEVTFVYDLVLFGLTLYKAHTTVHHNMDFVGALGRRSLMQVLISDGSLYFAVVALSNMTNILSFYLSEASFKGGLSTFASCISVTMMSRLMLNLQAANRGTEWDSFSGHSLHFARPPGSCSDPDTA
ncbi:hypothetical protein K435DRAFT_865510 [Dendrothele bispora CBS 962.96]|uniref:Uncharacterized protein n=1 Tax=Dendrothele bispora (strain CBS 962.96) TaxID=1314807 RepID=A0A4S8LJE9_DENBC|nr:hypothetical protein K435DRAFT_865510 [Dendrothele bispora CBS 962.96]